MSADPTEWQDIFISTGPETRPAMSMPPRVIATKKFIAEVADELNLDSDTAQNAADWIADKMERFGASSAQPVFDMDGNGPSCSWCGVIWPLCGHQHLSVALGEDDS